MNRNIYRLVRNQFGLWVPVPEFARSKTKGGNTKATKALLSTSMILASVQAFADGGLPTACGGSACAGAAAFIKFGNANYIQNGNTGTVSQVGNQAILNWRNFNISAGNRVIFQQVSDLLNLQLVPGANFSTLNRIWDNDPSVIAGSIQSATGQKANLTFINQNGIIFANGAQTDVNSLTASALNLSDNFFINGLFSNDVNVTPQFQNGLDDQPNLGGFVKVLEGAKITANTGGRVMLIAPTVTNRGTINTPSGQTILAAGSKVFLAANKEPLLTGLLVEVDNSQLANGEYDKQNNTVPSNIADNFDKLGNATNLGDITSAKGNVTMVGLAVNQMNNVSATTSLVQNGTVFLMAKSGIKIPDGLPGVTADRAGKLTLGKNSKTEVLPDVADQTKSKEKLKPSRIDLVGKEILVEEKANIIAPAGEVNFYAVTDPSTVTAINAAGSTLTEVDPFNKSSASLKEDTRILIKSDALIDVSGIDVNLSVSDNIIKQKLQGDELANSPLNRTGELRGKEVWLDLTKGSPLVANIADIQNSVERTVAYRSKDAGKINFNSTGDVVVQSGAKLDVSGGKVTYAAGQANQTTLLGADGKKYKLEEAPANLKYLGLANQFTRNYERWGQSETFDRSKVFNAGYVEGANAGSLTLNTRQAYFSGQVNTSTDAGLLQRQTARLPLGATLQIGAGKLNNQSIADDYGLLQNIVLDNGPVALGSGFGMDSDLSEDNQQNFHLNSNLIGEKGFKTVKLYTNQNLSVDQNIQMASGGSFVATGQNLQVNENLSVPSGNIELSVDKNLFAPTASSTLKVADNVKLSTAGSWANDLKGDNLLKNDSQIDAGNIKLKANIKEGDTLIFGTLDLGKESVLDVRGGASRSFTNKVIAGKAGNVTIDAANVRLTQPLEAHLQGESLGNSGTVSVNTEQVQIGGVAPNAQTLVLDAGFFNQGFSTYTISGQRGLTIAENTKILAQTKNLELLPNVAINENASNLDNLTQTLTLPLEQRKAANVNLAATNVGTGAADFTMKKGAELHTDIGAVVNVSARRKIDIDGKINAPAGVINLAQDIADGTPNVENPNQIRLGDSAVLSVAGAAKLNQNSKNQTVGTVFSSGTVNINAFNGFVSAKEGAVIDVSGAKPVKIDILNMSGRIGQEVASDAGAFKVQADSGIYLDNTFKAEAGSKDRRGGSAEMKLVSVDPSQNNDKLTHVGSFSKVSPDSDSNTGKENQAYADLAKLETAGFERINVKSGDKIIFEGDVKLGASKPLQSLVLDAPNISSDGGTTQLSANIVQIGNSSLNVPDESNIGSGKLAFQADLIELLGQTSYSGFSNINFNSTGEIRLSGIRPINTLKAEGSVKTNAALDFTASVISPSSLTNFSVEAINNDIQFKTAPNSTFTQPLSVLSQLKVSANNIVQSGRIVAPFGKVDLKANDTLTLADGSLTSTSAVSGSILPLGNTLNGTNWFVDLNNDSIVDEGEKIASISNKQVKLDAKNVVTKSTAVVDISGGGDIQASEFSVGPGGLIDVLAPVSGVSTYYAILPNYKGIAAPSQTKDSTINPVLGQTVYLAGGNGLAAGNYTLLPAEYALLPGAYAIKLSGGVPDVIPAKSFTKVDGTHVIAGFISDGQFKQSEVNTARWTGFELLTRDEVRQKSEYNLTLASNFYAKNAASALPADAGLLQVKASNSLALDAKLLTSASQSSKFGRAAKGAAVDIAADKLAILDGTSNTQGQVGEVVLNIADLNALKADSLLIGALRETEPVKANTNVLDVQAISVRMDTASNTNQTSLSGKEIMLAAKETVSVNGSSKITADGANNGTQTTYSISGDGAFVRAGTSSASVVRNGVTRITGEIIGDVSTNIVSSSSIILDATKDNNYVGQIGFNGEGNLSLGANRINFGEIPDTATGLNFDQQRLDNLGDLQSLKLATYSTFDFYGNTELGQYDANKTKNAGYSIASLSLDGGTLRGINSASDSVNIQAKTLEISNPSNIAKEVGTGSGSFNIKTTQLTLGANDKSITGFAQTNINATEVIAQDKGKLSVDGPLTINTARISGQSGANQSIETAAALVVAQAASNAALAATKSVGASWAFKGSSINFAAPLEAHSGSATLEAATGNVSLASTAQINVSGQPFAFFDQVRAPDAGQVKLIANNGDVIADTGAVVDVSAAPGGDAGQVIVKTPKGNTNLANATLRGSNLKDSSGKQGKGASISIDTKNLNDFDGLNTKLNAGGFAETRSLRLREGDVTIAQSGANAFKSSNVLIEADTGKITVTGEIDASGNNNPYGAGGKIALQAKDGVILGSTANLNAAATTVDAKGGKVILATTSGTLDLQTGSRISVSDSQGADSGEVLLRAPRTGAGAGTDVAVTALDGSIAGSNNTVIEAVQTYENITQLSDTGTGSTLSFGKIATDVASFMGNKASVLGRLGKTNDTKTHLKAGVEVQSSSDLTVAKDWNLYSASRPGDEPGTLTLKAANNLIFNGSLSDGVIQGSGTGSTATRDSVGVGQSWSYRLVAGADSSAVNPLTTKDDKTGNFVLAENKRIRTGTGDIEIAAAGNFDLGKKNGADNQQTGVIYTLGTQAPTLAEFTVASPNILAAGTSSLAPQANNFTFNGGDISIDVKGDIFGAPTNQLYSNWLFRQGKVNAQGGFDANNPQTAWWVRFDQFQQGIGALGGGNVTVKAGGNIENLSVSSATNGRMDANKPESSKLNVLGGGDVLVQAEGDIAGGQFYTGKGQLTLDAGGDIKEKRVVNEEKLYTTIALGDTQASIKANGDVNIQAVVNPTLVAQTISSSNSALTNVNQNLLNRSTETKKTAFSTYTDNTSISFKSISGDIVLHNRIGEVPRSNSSKPISGGLIAAYNSFRPSGASEGLTYTNQEYSNQVLNFYPGTLKANAFNGDISINGDTNYLAMLPATLGNLELLAENNVNVNQSIYMINVDKALIPSADSDRVGFKLTPLDIYATLESFIPQTSINLVHQGDTTPSYVYGLKGDIKGPADAAKAISIAKSGRFIAGNDISNIGILTQNTNNEDVTYIKAGRDLQFESNLDQARNEIKVAGPGRLEIEVGRDLDLGFSSGISTIGNLSNPALVKDGSDIEIAVGVPNGVDYIGAVDRLLLSINNALNQNAAVSESTLWQARWLTGNSDLSRAPTALLNAVSAVKSQTPEIQRERVRSMFYQALRDTGRDYNDQNSDYAGQYNRGYDTIELLFPGVTQANIDGSSTFYDGQINMALTSIKTNRGGNIDWMIPGGGALIGLAQISDAQLPIGRTTTQLGVVALEDGDVRGFSRDDILVNQSRVLTVGGGDILLWSSEGDLDAGKGKRTASSLPPPIITVDPKSGAVTVELQGAATGSGIGALGANAGDVDLIAPRGTVNAGDAGVRARNVNIAAQTVLNAGNISATGSSSGVPVSDSGALGGALAGAGNVGTDAVRNVASDVSESAAKSAAQPFISPLLPSIISVEVISIGK